MNLHDNLPHFSVITIVLNAEKTIERTIQSVLKQDYPDIEYVIIDGGSTDGTLKIIDKYKDRIAKVISEKDHGIADAFNKGIRNSTGKWIGILNADDWYDDGVLALIASRLHDDTDILTAKTRFWRGPKSSYIFHADPDKIELDTTIGHQSTFVKRSVYDRLGLYRVDLKYASDYDFFLKAKLAGMKFKNLDMVIANMQDEGVSDTQWKHVYAEVAQVQSQRLNKPIRARARFFYKVIRTSVSRSLTQLGLESVVAYYRRHHSILRKDRDL